MLWDLEEDVRNREAISHDENTIKEFEAFIHPEGEEWPRATSGYHDDAVMAWAGVMEIRKFYVSPDSLKITSGRYKG